MSERILRIVEFYEGSSDDDWESYEGFIVFTEAQAIRLAISAYQSCCESWGYFMSEDDLERFIGAELRGVSITNTNRSKKSIKDLSLDEGEVLFVDIETDRGVLQFVAYNAHNGYYGHTAKVVSDQLTEEVTL